MSWGELAHLGGNYTLKFLMEKTQLKQNETTTPARFGCPDQQQIYQSPWWKKPRIHPLGAHPNQVEARTLRWWGVSPAWKIHWITISHPESLKMAACASRPCVSSDACTLGWGFDGRDWSWKLGGGTVAMKGDSPGAMKKGHLWVVFRGWNTTLLCVFFLK